MSEISLNSPGGNATADQVRQINESLGLDTAVKYDINITSLQGGTSTDLDNISTISLTVGKVLILPRVTIGVNVVSKMWFLDTGTDATNLGNGVLRPVDYAATTNEKVWKAI